eukprot:COSAG06_NODE_30238_length_542_cov_0.945824_1_plen_65_part_10
MKLKIKLLKGGDFEMEIDASVKVTACPLSQISRARFLSQRDCGGAPCSRRRKIKRLPARRLAAVH